MDLGDRLRSLNQDISTWKLLSLLLAGGLFGAVVLRADSPWWDEAHKDFAGKSSFVLWGGLICSQTALWALVLAWLGPSVLRLGANYGAENRTEVLASTAMILGIIVLFTVGTPLVKPWPNYMPHHVVKIALLSLVGGFVVLVDALGVWFVHGGLKKLATEELATEKALRTFLALDTELHRFLGTLGAILGLFILSTSAQREAVLAYKPDTEYGYEFVLVQGFLFSALIAAVYLPTYLTLDEVGKGIRDAFFPDLPPTSPEWDDRTAKRERLGGVLRIQVGPFGRFKASAAILTPLVGSLIGLLL